MAQIRHARKAGTGLWDSYLDGAHGGERFDEHDIGGVVAQGLRRAGRPAQPQLEWLRQRRQAALQAARVRPPEVACCIIKQDVRTGPPMLFVYFPHSSAYAMPYNPVPMLLAASPAVLRSAVSRGRQAQRAAPPRDE